MEGNTNKGKFGEVKEWDPQVLLSKGIREDSKGHVEKEDSKVIVNVSTKLAGTVASVIIFS